MNNKGYKIGMGEIVLSMIIILILGRFLGWW